MRHEPEPGRQVGCAPADLVDLRRDREQLAIGIASPGQRHQGHRLGAVRHGRAKHLREAHRLLRVALDGRRARLSHLGNDQGGIELGRRGVTIPRPRIPGALERRPGHHLVPGVGTGGPAVPARHHRCGTGGVSLEEERRHAGERVLLLGDAQILVARHGVLEGDVGSAGHQTDQCALPRPVERSAGAPRLQLKCPREVLLDVWEGARSAGTEIALDGLEDGVGLQVLERALVAIEEEDPRAGREKEHHPHDERGGALALGAAAGIGPGRHRPPRVLGGWLEHAGESEGIEHVARVRHHRPLGGTRQGGIRGERGRRGPRRAVGGMDLLERRSGALGQSRRRRHGLLHGDLDLGGFGVAERRGGRDHADRWPSGGRARLKRPRVRRLVVRAGVLDGPHVHAGRRRVADGVEGSAHRRRRRVRYLGRHRTRSGLRLHRAKHPRSLHPEPGVGIPRSELDGPFEDLLRALGVPSSQQHFPEPAVDGPVARSLLACRDERRLCVPEALRLDVHAGHRDEDAHVVRMPLRRDLPHLLHERDAGGVAQRVAESDGGGGARAPLPALNQVFDRFGH